MDSNQMPTSAEEKKNTKNRSGRKGKKVERGRSTFVTRQIGGSMYYIHYTASCAGPKWTIQYLTIALTARSIQHERDVQTCSRLNRMYWYLQVRARSLPASLCSNAVTLLL